MESVFEQWALDGCAGKAGTASLVGAAESAPLGSHS
jgi:hypothetical protein